VSNPLREGLEAGRVVPPCTVVIFGAGGDLTRRKLMPALYNLAVSRALPGGFAVVGISRGEKSDDAFREEMHEAVGTFSRKKPIDPGIWTDFAPGLFFQAGAFGEAETYAKLKERLETIEASRGTKGNRLFYLAVPPSEVRGIVEGLRGAGLVEKHTSISELPFTRIIAEKPFGHDRASAAALNGLLGEVFGERQVFRIDHYLGKETVQNLLVFRFANSLFEPLWNREHVDHVQITVAEDIGVEGRGRFYEQTGALRDIVQNHALQLLCLTAMEPPISLHADAVRDEKVKVLRSLRPLGPRTIRSSVVRGQYTGGFVRGNEVPAYRQEPDVAAESSTETFVAMRVFVDSWRWGGVPFYVRAGKRLNRRATEVAIHFKRVPHAIFPVPDGGISPNVLTMRIQPDEQIALRFTTKEPGQNTVLRDVAMDFRYGSTFGSNTPEAYERLLLDAMRGDATLFTRADEAEQQWAFVEPILAAWQENPTPPPMYDAGSWGPEASHDLLAADGRRWRKP